MMEKSTKTIEIKPPYLDTEVLTDLEGAVYTYRIKEQEKTEIVLGYSSRPQEELKIQNILKDGIEVYKRKGGGCGVVLLKGMIIISIGYKTRMYPGITEAMLLINKKIIEALKSTGIKNVTPAGISDLAINNKKILGCSLYRGKEFSIYQGSLIVDADLSLVERYLKHPPREPNYRMGRKHSNFLTTILKEHKSIDKDLLIKNLKKQLTKPFWIESIVHSP